MGQTNVHRYLPRLLDYIRTGKIDPSFVITHTLALDDAPRGYETFHKNTMNASKSFSNRRE
jgi:threonine dehydrogenase-like Zn-dependent dehydrogenase